jgi:disulfide bond formation protein DsbB
MMYYDSCFSIMEKMYKKIINLINSVFQNYFELTLMFSALLVIIIAIAMDEFLYLQACALCVLTRYIFGLVAVSSLVGFLFKKDLISAFLIFASSIIGMLVTSRQIYIQNMAPNELAQLSGCGMPFHAQVEYFGLYDAIRRTLAGGPSCAEDGWRFIFNFAEYGFLFFTIYLVLTIFKYRKLVKFD